MMYHGYEPEVSTLDYKWRDTCSSSSIGRALRCQRKGCEFEARLLLQEGLQKNSKKIKVAPLDVFIIFKQAVN